MNKIEDWKNRGNQFFKLKDYLKAINCWEEALQIIKDREQFFQSQAQIQDNKLVENEKTKDIQDKLKELGVMICAVTGNLALGHLKRNEIDEAEFYNGTCLQYDQNNQKAHYRMIQIYLARNELEQAQSHAIRCTSLFKDLGVQAIQPFKEILTGEIQQKIRQRQDKDTIENELLELEKTMRQLINDQKTVQNEIVEKYINILNYFRNEKEFPFTLTAVFMQELIQLDSYDEQITIQILENTRFNKPFRDLLINDVIKPNFIDLLLSNNQIDQNGENIFVIDKYKIQRKPLICSIFTNLVKFSDIDFIRVIVDQYLIFDFDSNVQSLNMINILAEILQNEKYFSLKNEIKIECQEQIYDNLQVSCYQLTNQVYMDIILQMLKFYFNSFEENLVVRQDSEKISMNTKIDSFEQFQNQETAQKIIMKSLGIDVDDLVTGGFSSLKCKYLKIELILIEIFKFYNAQKDYTSNGEQQISEELLCLSKNIWNIDITNSQNDISLSLFKILGLSILFKVYNDMGYKLICDRKSSILNNMVPLDWLLNQLNENNLSFSNFKSYIFTDILNTLALSKKGRQLINEKKYFFGNNLFYNKNQLLSQQLFQCTHSLTNKFSRLQSLIIKFQILIKLICSINDDEIINHLGAQDQKEVQIYLKNIFYEFINILLGITECIRFGGISDDIYSLYVIQSILDTLGYMAFKHDFKIVFYEACKNCPKFIESFKYLILLAVQYNEKSSNSAENQQEMFIDKFQSVTALIFFILNMLRSDDYQILVPSHTIKIKENLQDKETSYYEIQQLQKLIRNSPKIANQLFGTSQQSIDYGPEKYLVQNIRQIFVKDLNALGLLNGQASVSKQGPKSAEDFKSKKSYSQKNNAFNIENFIYKRDFNLSKSKRAGIHIKHMVSEILLLIACNNLSNSEIFQQENQDSNLQQLNLIPFLVANNMISYIFDLRQSIFRDSSKSYDLAIEADINLSQTLAKIFTYTNPVLINEYQKFDAMKLMAKRLLCNESHHELLIFEALLALTNIATCFQNSYTGSSENKFSNEMINIICSTTNPDDQSQQLFFLLTRQFLFDKNLRIKIATCELISNLSLCEFIQQQAENLDDGNQKSIQFKTDCNNLLNVLIQTQKEYENGQVTIEILESLWKAIFGFYANLCSYQGIREIFSSLQNGKVIDFVIPQIFIYIHQQLQSKLESKFNEYQSIIHRILYIADEILREDEINIFERFQKKDYQQVIECLQVIVKQNENNNKNFNSELKALCQQFIQIYKGNRIL